MNILEKILELFFNFLIGLGLYDPFPELTEFLEDENIPTMSIFSEHNSEGFNPQYITDNFFDDEDKENFGVLGMELSIDNPGGPAIDGYIVLIFRKNLFRQIIKDSAVPELAAIYYEPGSHYKNEHDQFVYLVPKKD